MAPADVAAHVQRRVKRIAEQAFWDSVQATLADSASAGVSQQQVTGQLAGLLAHMGGELMAVLPEQARAAREQLAAELDEGRLQEALTAHQVWPCTPVSSPWYCYASVLAAFRSLMLSNKRIA